MAQFNQIWVDQNGRVTNAYNLSMAQAQAYVDNQRKAAGKPVWSPQVAAGSAAAAKSNYNPYAYVPGGSSPTVSQAIQEHGYGLGSPSFDLAGLLTNDPMLQGQLRQIGWGETDAQGNLLPPTGMLAQTLAPLDEQYKAALINYGGVPDSVQIDNTTRGLANDATTSGLSTLAGLRRNYLNSNSFVTGQAAARGMGHSGSPGVGLINNSLNYDVNRASEQSKLMSALSGFDQQRVGAYSTAMGQAQTATNDAQTRLNTQINNGTIAAPADLTNAKLPIPPPTGDGSFVPRPAVATTHASPKPQVGVGQPGNRFQVLPGRGRAPLGDYRTQLIPGGRNG